MKILLVNPPIPRVFRMFDFADDAVRKSFGRRVMVGPPLALNELASMVPDDEVVILDQKTEEDNIPGYDFAQVYAEELKRFSPDFVGVTCITAQYNSVLKILNITKEYDKSILTMVGGIHPTLCPDSFAGSKADLVTVGIGKYSFKKMIEIFKADGWLADFSRIPGLGLNKGTSLFYTQSICSLSTEDIKEQHILDTVMPNRKLTDKYNYTIRQMGKKIHYISTSQGCTHKCNFCSIWQTTGGRYFHKDVECIIRELKTMDEYPIIRFCDANTFGDIKKARLLFTRIIEEGLNHHYYLADVRTDTVIRHPDIIELAVKAGLRITICGLEATSNEELEAYNKQNTIENISGALKFLNSLGILVNGNYIVRPEYVESDFDRVAQFVSDNPIYHAGFTVLTPFPGTDLYETMKKDIINHNLDYYNLTNAVVETVLPEAKFYEQVGKLYKTSKVAGDEYRLKYGSDLLVE